jgi:hypothetical protein
MATLNIVNYEFFQTNAYAWWSRAYLYESTLFGLGHLGIQASALLAYKPQFGMFNQGCEFHGWQLVPPKQFTQEYSKSQSVKIAVL